MVRENYARLKRCVCISILDFNLDDSPKYHKVYRLRDEEGNEYTDMLEVHIIELGKKINGTWRMDEWIRLFNAKTEEDLSMLQSQTKNPGVLEAIREVKLMGLGKDLIALYDAHMKQVRDRNARDAYVYDEGVAEGRAEETSRMQTLISKMTEAGETEKLAMLADKAFYEEMLRKYGL